MPAKSGDLGSRVVNGLVGAGAAFAVRKVMSMAWKKARGSEPPGNPEDPEVALGEAIVWAVLVGAAIAIARIIAIRIIGPHARRSIASRSG
jgi:Protein of unknown function (DUF4235)